MSNLDRFGKVDPGAAVIERLCNCGTRVGLHSDMCRAVMCSDCLPHSGDPCYVCESTPEEFVEILRYPGFRPGCGYSNIKITIDGREMPIPKLVTIGPSAGPASPHEGKIEFRYSVTVPLFIVRRVRPPRYGQPGRHRRRAARLRARAANEARQCFLTQYAEPPPPAAAPPTEPSADPAAGTSAARATEAGGSE